MKPKKIAVICMQGLDNFLNWVEHIEGYEIKIFPCQFAHQIEKAVSWADIVFLEWMNDAAVHATKYRNIVYKDQVIIRCHSYEAFTNFAEMINWDVVTDLIFVADHVKKVVIENLKRLGKIKTEAEKNNAE